MAFSGQTDRAVELAKQALDLALAPSRTHWAYQAAIQFLGGNYQAAIDAVDRSQGVVRGLPDWRAAALAHLGQVEEAAAEAQRSLARIRQTWFGDEAATDATIVRWLLHLYPIRRRDAWERLRDGLRIAGLPTVGLAHHKW
jgi:tetratricopeptide (TPR) repeat protein